MVALERLQGGGFPLKLLFLTYDFDTQVPYSANVSHKQIFTAVVIELHVYLVGSLSCVHAQKTGNSLPHRHRYRIPVLPYMY